MGTLTTAAAITVEDGVTLTGKVIEEDTATLDVTDRDFTSSTRGAKVVGEKGESINPDPGYQIARNLGIVLRNADVAGAPEVSYTINSVFQGTNGGKTIPQCHIGDEFVGEVTSLEFLKDGSVKATLADKTTFMYDAVKKETVKTDDHGNRFIKLLSK
jgi:hypothetical protein